MRRRIHGGVRGGFGICVVALLALVPAAANAKTLDWHGTSEVKFGSFPTIRFLGSGVATVNDSSGGPHLSTMRLAGGITGTGTFVVTDPDTTGTIPSIRFTGTMGTGTLSGISGAPPLNPPAALPTKGFTRVCLFVPGCATFLPLNNTTNNGNTGIGVGGQLTLGGFGAIRISLVNDPWTLGTANAVNQTVDGGFKTISKTGFVHGAASGSSSTATGSGLIQLIAPVQITVTGIAGNNSQISLFQTLSIHFIPEPGLLLLLGSGVVGVALLGRRRMQR